MAVPFTGRPTTSRSECHLHRADPLTRDRNHVSRTELRSPSHLNPTVHPHLLGLDKLARVRPVLCNASQLEELTQPNRQLANGNVLNL
jgi:hypothetical protein